MAKIETKAVKGAENQFPNTRPVASPIYLSSTYLRNEDGGYTDGMVYSRHSNPNRSTLEGCLADLEGGEVAFAFASGMAAVSAVFQSLDAGDEVLIPDDAYYSVSMFLNEVMARWGLKTKIVDMSNIQSIEAEITKKTKLIWVETPSNPQLKVSDINGISNLAKEHSILLAVDNTWPTPVLQNPLDLGADMVVHSSTKYLGGHSDVLSGAVIFSKENEYSNRVQNIQKLGGGVPSPFDCWLVSRGIQTLPIRVKTQSESALKLAKWFTNHPKIDRVLYPGLSSHEGHELAKNQMHDGFGGMLSVLIKENVNKILEISNQLRYFTTATSLGGVESLVEHRKSVEGPESTTPENLLRISVGLENVEDLIADWEQALSM